LRITIYPTPTDTGKFTLTDSLGYEAEGGKEYDTREQALEAARVKWPPRSRFRGQQVSHHGWRITLC